MKEIRYEDLAQFLKNGRESEFAYEGKRYSITTNGYWQLCRDEDAGSVLLERICPYEERDDLSVRIGEIILEGMSIRQIFDDLLYDERQLSIL